MNDSIKLTVAIPTFDREVYLGQVLQSLQQQTDQSFKVILFDNASSYDIRALIDRFPTLTIELQQNEVNIGNQANFARVMAHEFDTPYVMIFHDDDTIHPDYFEHALQILEHNTSFAWLGSYINFTHDPDVMLTFKPAVPSPAHQTYHQAELADAFMANEPIGFSSVIYQRNVLRTTKPNTARFNKWFDRPFMLESCHNHEVAIMTFPYINYRIHASQDSAQSYRDHLTEMINLIEYFSRVATPGRKNHIFATTSTVKTAAVNATSIRDFFAIIKQFSDRGLYSIRYVRPYTFVWLVWILGKRLRHFLLNK